MQKFFRFITTLTVLGGLLALRPLLALASVPVEVAVGTSCTDLNASNNPAFANIKSNFGLKVIENFNRSFTFEEASNLLFTAPLEDGQPQDPFNTATLSLSNNLLNWSSTLSLDAVIVQGQTTAYAFVYSPEEKSENGLSVPPGAGTLENVTSVELCYDYELTGTKTANATWQKTIDWTIAKTAQQAPASAFAGQTANLDYSVELTKTETPVAGSFKVSGTITVKNQTPYTVPRAVVTDSVGGTAATVDCGGTPPNANVLVLPAGAVKTCTYTATLADKVDGTNTATLTIDDPIKAFVGDGSASAAYAFGAGTLAPGSEPETITVNDTLKGSLGSFSAGQTVNYSLARTCPSDQASYTGGVFSETLNNTASIVETTGDSSSDSATVNCYAPLVSKTANAVTYKTIDWTVGKNVTPASASQFAGENASFDYTVSLVKNETFGPHLVDGIISVSNPAGAPAAMAVTVSDVVGSTAAVVDCGGGSTSLNIAAGTTGTCSYTASLPAAQDGTNTASATFNGLVFTGSADFTFGAPTLSQTSEPESVTVSDSLQGSLGTYSTGATIPYTRTPACSTDIQSYSNGFYTTTIPNTVSLTTGDSASASVTLDCYAPLVSKTAAGSYDERHDWTVAKSVNLAAQDAFAGANAAYQWTVEVTENVVEENFAVAGQIVVTNPHPGATMVAGLGDVLNDAANTAGLIAFDPDSCNYSAGVLTIPAAGTATCVYAAVPAGRTATLNTATVLLNGLAASASADVAWTPNLIHPTVVLSDDQAAVPPWPAELDAGGSWTYNDSHTCSASINDYTAGKYTFGESNTAVLSDGGVTINSSTANVAVNCYAPLLSKTAAGSYAERHDWALSKAVAPNNKDAFAGESTNYTWTVEVTEQVVEENFSASGVITVDNPAPMAMSLGLTDTLSDSTAASITPGASCAYVNGTLTIPASGTASCPYTAAPAGRTATSNTTTAALNGASFSASAALAWTPSLINPSVVLDDGLNPAGAITLVDGDIISYPGSHICSAEPAAYTAGKYTFSQSNTATLTTLAGAPLDSATDVINVNCYAPLMSKSAAGSYGEIHSWSLSKSASPAAQKAFAGDTASFTWTVTATDQVTPQGFDVTGSLVVTNPAPMAMSLDLSDTLSDGTPVTIIKSNQCNYENGRLNLAATDTATCELSAAPTSSAATSNTATATTNFGASFTASAEITWTAQAVNASVVLDDDRNPAFPQTISASGSFPYPASYTCSTNPAAYTNGVYTYIEPNTATLHTLAGAPLASVSASASVTCYAPVVDKSILAETSSSLNWTILKSVAPLSASAFAGQSVDFNYTVNLTKDATSGLNVVSGEIFVTNPAGSPGAMDVSVSDTLSPAGLGDIALDVDCGGGTPSLSVASGAQGVCSYRIELPSAANGTNTATASLNGHAFSAAVPYTFVPVQVESEPATVNVTDDNATPADTADDLHFGPYSDSATIPYARQAACPADPAAYTNGVFTQTFHNMVKIDETPDEDGASAVLTCYAPLVSKDAQAEWFREVSWTIGKSVLPASADVFAGGSAAFDYTVSLTKAVNEYGFRAFGAISVTNPHPTAAMTVNVADAMGASAAVVNCGAGSSSLTVAAGATGTCSYSIDLPDATGGSNTATVSLGQVDFTAAAAVVFGAPVLQGEPETITVADSLQGDLGSFSASATIPYAHTQTCSSDPAAYTNGAYSASFNNTASINETQGDSASAGATLNCYAPLVGKTAAGTYDLINSWSVSKSASPADQKAFAGDTASVDWTVVVSMLGAESNYAVSGEISVFNPAPLPMSVILSDSLPVTVTPDASCDFQDGLLNIPAGQTATCAYSASLLDIVPGNTATVTLNGLAFSASADIGWTANVTNPSVTLDDDLGPDFPIELTQGGTFIYTRSHVCSAEQGLYPNGSYTFSESNTAQLVDAAGSLVDSATDSASVTCYAPLLEKTAQAQTSTALDWTIAKSVTPSAASAFAGSSVDFNYTITLTRNEQAGINEVSGTISVSSPAGSPGPMNVTVSDLVAGTPAVVDCGGGTASLSVAPGTTGVCSYSASLASPLDGTNTATVSFNGHDYTVSKDYTFVAGQVDSEPATVSVVDSLQGDLGTFSDSATIPYTRSQVCPADPAAYTNGIYSASFNNTAKINETPDQASASVTLTCYAPLVSKTAETYWHQAWDWTITKQASASYDLFAGSSISHGYQVSVTPVSTANLWGVMGEIIIANPHPGQAMTLDSVSDLAGGIIAGVNCPSSVVPAGGSLICGYDTGAQDSPNANPFGGTNTATVAFGGASWTAEQAIIFSADPTSEANPVIHVSDSSGESWTADRAVATWEYSRDVACATGASYVDGIYSFTRSNTATISETGQSASATVDVNCYAPQVSSSLSTAYTRTYDWAITKGPSQTYERFAGQSVDHDYQVAVDALLVDDGWQVLGTILIKNPNPHQVMDLDNVSDEAGGFLAIVACPGLAIPAGGSLTCTFDSGLQSAPNANPFGGTNTAAAAFGGATWADSKPISFGDPTSEVNPVITVDDDNLSGENWTADRADAFWPYSLPFACSSDPADYTNGRYSFSHTNTATILETNQSASATVEVSCLFPTSPVRVVKQIDQGAEAIGQFPITFGLYPAGANDPLETIQLTAGQVGGDGSYTLEFATLPLPGIWTVKELLPAGWASEGLSCTFEVKFDPGIEAYTCSFSNRELSRVSVFKTTEGLVDPTRDFNFAIFAGAQQGAGAAFLADPPLASASTFGDADGLLHFADDLDPLLSYTLCELPAASGSWISLWSLNGAPLATYDPGQYESSPWMTGYRCADFGALTSAPLDSGERLAFSVDNRPADATAKGAGYWKVNASCSRSNRSLAPSLKQTFFSLDELLSRYYFSIGALELSAADCQPAVSVLDQRDAATGAKKASDAAFWLASHLFSYRLNQAAGICYSPSAAAAADAAQGLLLRLNFNGTGDYLKKGADFNQALTISAELERYNNGLSCGK